MKVIRNTSDLYYILKGMMIRVENDVKREKENPTSEFLRGYFLGQFDIVKLLQEWTDYEEEEKK